MPALSGSAPVPGTVDAEGALRALIAASSLELRPFPTCQAVIVGVPRPTLGDFLATPLAALDGGTNRVGGGCTRCRCHVAITHAAGEDVFAYEYRFRMARGRLVPASLECFFTP